MPNGESSPLSALDRAVLFTVLYADLFDFALTRNELFERLVGKPATFARVDAAIVRLRTTYLSTIGEFVVWEGREHAVDTRRRRRAAASGLWRTAGRYGRWLAHVPFVRMVAVSGSLAVENAEPTSDVDLFCITQTDRLWLARLFIVPLSKLTRRFPEAFPRYLCPNYILAMDAMEVTDRNLFTAHEVAQAVPVWGADVFRRFLNANRWVLEYMPNRTLNVSNDGVPGPRRPLSARAVEWLLRGRIGDTLNRIAHRLFVAFYRRRADRAGWDWASLAPAYRHDRYTVPEGGYVRVVQHHYERLVRDRLPGVYAADLETLFPEAGGDGPACYDWEGLFRKEYGRDASSPRQTVVEASRTEASDR